MDFKSLQKGIFTTTVGIVIVGIIAHQYIESGEFNMTMMLTGLTAIGLFGAKDQGSSHTK